MCSKIHVPPFGWTIWLYPHFKLIASFHHVHMLERLVGTGTYTFDFCSGDIVTLDMHLILCKFPGTL